MRERWNKFERYLRNFFTSSFDEIIPPPSPQSVEYSAQKFPVEEVLSLYRIGVLAAFGGDEIKTEQITNGIRALLSLTQSLKTVPETFFIDDDKNTWYAWKGNGDYSCLRASFKDPVHQRDYTMQYTAQHRGGEIVARAVSIECDDRKITINRSLKTATTSSCIVTIDSYIVTHVNNMGENVSEGYVIEQYTTPIIPPH